MWSAIVMEEPPADLARAHELDAFAARHGVAFPPDHRAFLMHFGQGVVFNHFRVFGLAMMEEALAEARGRWRDYFAWSGPDNALQQPDLATCIVIGDTFNGDEIVVSPSHPGQLFYLPHGATTISALGTSLEQALYALVGNLKTAIAGYPEDEQEEWDLRPVFNRESF